MLVVLIERQAPRHLLRGGVDHDRASQRADRCQQLAGDLADGAVGAQRNALLTPASWVRRSNAATSVPERSGAGNGAVSQPLAVSRSAARCNSVSGGASATASLPRTWVWA
jgi:hypothetical protein